MIERIYLRDNLSLKEVDLNIKKGLIVFSGVSGAGKSIFMDSILSLFGLRDVKSKEIEATLNVNINLLNYGLDCEDVLILKLIKKEKVRYFLNNSAISKKVLLDISSKFIRFLNLKEFSDFKSDSLINLIDNSIALHNSSFLNLLKEYKENFLKLKNLKLKFSSLEANEKRVVELREFLNFEISKIRDINPKESEYEELLSIKKSLSKKDKIDSLIKKVSNIFEYERALGELFELLGVDGSFIDDPLNELRNIIDSANDKLAELEFVDIENVLNRIESLNALNKRYGSISEAIKYRLEKEEELKKYDEIPFEKNNLKKEIDIVQKSVESFATEISHFRCLEIENLNKKLNSYLNKLSLKDGKFEISKNELNINGFDNIDITLNSTQLDDISSGEFNRLRLALLALKSEFIEDGGILILDEIDANLSGEESKNVALVIEFLSRKYQIFAISHQPHLPSLANQHFLVYKDSDESKIKELNGVEQIREIARMIAGDKIIDEALELAKQLLKGKKC